MPPFLADPHLTWKAKGLLAYLLSTPGPPKARIADLVALATDGAAAVRAGLRELRDRGYLHSRPTRDPATGHIGAPVLTVLAEPRPQTIVSTKKHPSPHAGEPRAENRHPAMRLASPDSGFEVCDSRFAMSPPPSLPGAVGQTLIAVLGLYVRQIGDPLTSARLAEIADLVTGHSADLAQWHAAFHAAEGKRNPWHRVRQAIRHPKPPPAP